MPRDVKRDYQEQLAGAVGRAGAGAASSRKKRLIGGAPTAPAPAPAPAPALSIASILNFLCYKVLAP